MDPENLHPSRSSRKKTFLQISLISLIFGGVGFFVYHLPIQTCGLLHYEPTKIDANGIEFCKDEAGAMLDLDRLKLPIKLDARWDNGMLHVRLSNKRGDTFFPYEIAYSHTEKLHLFIVDEAAHEYYHLHPAGDSMTGEWKAPFSPRSSGIFRIFAQCVHARTKRTLTTVTEIFANKDEDCDASLHNSHIQVSLINRPSADQIGSTIPLSFEINHPNLGPLEPLMGAYAHVALFQRENHQFGHLHPLASSETSKNKSMVNFLLNYNSTGPHILWLQFQLQGKCYFNRFEWQDT